MSLLPFEDALEAISKSVETLVSRESLPLSHVLGRISGQNITATSFVPPHDNSAMDGYALRSADWQQDKVFHISQRIPAGKAPHTLKPGTCARIFTGANIPDGADTVIMQEDAITVEEGVLFNEQPTPGENIRPKGQDISQGHIVLREGTLITPMHIGLLSSLGMTHIQVFKPLKVGILTTGDELIEAGKTLQPGQIFNSNGPMLSALVVQAGHSLSQVLHAKDSPEEVEIALTSLISTSDVILSSGGVSVGEEDHVKTVLEKLGELHLWKIAIKPGKPLVHATLKGKPFLGLPGNPSSTLVTFHWFANTVLAICSGRKEVHYQPYSIEAGFNRANTIKRDEFLRVSIGPDGLAHAHPQQSSGALLAACETHGYLHIKAHTPIEYGHAYPFYPFEGF